jgi:hypothetical protein
MRSFIAAFVVIASVTPAAAAEPPAYPEPTDLPPLHAPLVLPKPRDDRVADAVRRRLGTDVIDSASKDDQISQLVERVAILEKRLNEVPSCPGPRANQQGIP